MLPRAARDNEVAQARLTARAERGVRAAWRLMRGNWRRTWRESVAPRVIAVVTAGQEAAAAQSEAYVAAVLAETGLDASSPTSLQLPALVGVDGSGLPVESGLYQGVLSAVDRLYSPELASFSVEKAAAQALRDVEDEVAQLVRTMMADAARAAETLAMAQREWVTGYVRMIEPGACSRCVVLAGRFYLFNEGFDRHPDCRCNHIPASEDTRDSVLTNPDLYFQSLSKAEQNRVFTKAGAEAVRLGADVSQVVNARRGMNTAQQNPRGWIPRGRLKAVTMFGREAFVTTEGVTKNGVYGRNRGNKPVRLMPESILSLANGRDDAIRLLKVYGYIA